MVISYTPASGQGMLRDSESGRDLPFDRRSFVDPFLARVLAAGQYVTFGVIRDRQGERAIQVRVVP